MARRSSKKSVPMRLLSVSTRFFIYYLLYLTIWACPPTSTIDSSSPYMCGPLSKVFRQLDPYVSPVYQTHVEPYVNYVRPCVEYVKPYAKTGSDIYIKYAQPSVEKLSKRASDKITPYTDKVHGFYEQKIDPHRRRINTMVSKVYTTLDTSANKSYSLLAPHVIRIRQLFAEKVFPHLAKYSAKLYGFSVKYARLGCRWGQTVVIPKISEIYRGTVEPQIRRVYDRVFDSQRQSDSAEHSTKAVIEEIAVENVARLPDSATSAGTIPLDALTESVPGSSGSSISSTVSISASVSSAVSTLKSASSSSRDSASIASTLTAASTALLPSSSSSSAPVALSSSSPHPSDLSPTKQLEQWKTIVDDMTREAFAVFLDDTEMEKHQLMESNRAKFTDLLRSLQQAEASSVKQLSDLVAKLEADFQDEADEESYFISVDDIQGEFRRHAELIRDAAMAVRTEAQGFASKVVERIEALRASTLEVLDEFADVTLQEIGRNMVSVSSSSSTDSSNGGPNWKDWRSFRTLKERLIKSREDIVEHEVNMADVNKMLREIQETANVLSREAAQYFSGLRGKADYLLQQRVIRKSQRLAAEGKDEEPEDAVFYDASDEDHRPVNEKVEKAKEETADDTDHMAEMEVRGADAEKTKKEEIRQDGGVENGQEQTEETAQYIDRIQKSAAAGTAGDILFVPETVENDTVVGSEIIANETVEIAALSKDRLTTSNYEDKLIGKNIDSDRQLGSIVEKPNSPRCGIPEQQNSEAEQANTQHNTQEQMNHSNDHPKSIPKITGETKNDD